MWRWAKRTLVGLCGLVVVAALTGSAYQWIATRNDLAANPPPGRLVDVGGHKLHIWCTGSGEPTVVSHTSPDCVHAQPPESGLRPAQLVSRQTRVGVGKLFAVKKPLLDVKIRPQTQRVPLVRKPSTDAPWQDVAAQS